MILVVVKNIDIRRACNQKIALRLYDFVCYPCVTQKDLGDKSKMRQTQQLLAQLSEADSNSREQIPIAYRLCFKKDERSQQSLAFGLTSVE